MLGDLERQLGDYSLAEKHFRDALERNPRFSLARLGLAETIALAGRLREASEIWSDLVEEEDVEPEERITAAFDLANVWRAEHRFEESLLPLEKLDAEIRAEGIREPLSLVTRAMSAIELGRFDVAARWIDEAIGKASGALTRYWFARGLLELSRGQLDDALATARQIREYKRPQGPEGEEIERKAAAYLEGRVALKRGDTEAALNHFEESTGASGYAYALYELGLAEALAASGDLERAAEVAERAVSFRDPSEVRLDLELERARAQLLLARVLDEQGDESRSQERRPGVRRPLGRGESRSRALRPPPRPRASGPEKSLV